MRSRRKRREKTALGRIRAPRRDVIVDRRAPPGPRRRPLTHESPRLMLNATPSLRPSMLYSTRHSSIRPGDVSLMPRMNEDAGHAEPLDHDASDPDRARRTRLNALLLQVASGDQPAFAALYRQTSAGLFGVIVRMLRDRGEAEDILQEVYTSAWRRADQFDPARGSAMTWLVTLARHRAIDRLRQHREEALDEDTALDLPDAGPTPAAQAEASEERRRLEQCLGALDAPQRDAVREAFFTGATYSELAERVRVPLGTMKSWIRRSLIQLKTCLER